MLRIFFRSSRVSKFMSHFVPTRTMGFCDDFTRQNSNVWKENAYWRSLCPEMTLSENDPPVPSSKLASTSSDHDDDGIRRRTRLVQDGYALVDDVREAQAKQYRDLIEKIRNAVTKLHSQQFPATFVLLYDETWELARIAQRILENATHPSNAFNFDLLAWFIDPREGDSGFSPHRDRQPENAAASFHCPDEQAKYVTLWLALSDATPENSCLYVIPKPFDPGYTKGDDSIDQGESCTDGLPATISACSEKVMDPMRRALPTKTSYQCIRALPRQAGQAVLFTHRILHWGSRGNPNASNLQPRIAISFVCSDPTFERPYIDPKYLSEDSMPPFRMRLLLVCAQLLIYYQRFNLPSECIRACYEVCKESESELDESYRKKVMVEFVKAMKESCDERQAGISLSPSRMLSKNLTATNEFEDEEDDMLEEMLDAEAGGYGEVFEDDFDEEVAGDVGLDETESPEDDDHFEEFADESEDFSLFDKRRHSDYVVSESRKRPRTL